MPRGLSLVAALLSAALLSSSPAVAQGGGPPIAPVIFSALPNVDAGTLTIEGTNFGTATPVVMLGGFPLTVISNTGTQIVAALPSVLPNNYLLTVTKGGTALTDLFEITLEAGDVTGVVAGSGLTGGATSGDATLAVDTTQIQARVVGSCVAGSAIQSIDSGGNVTCEPDDDSSANATSANTPNTIVQRDAAGNFAAATITAAAVSAAGTITAANFSGSGANLTSLNAVNVTSGILPPARGGTGISICANGQVLKWSEAAWICAMDAVGAGTLTAVTASAPLTSSGGVTPNISLPHVRIDADQTAIGTNAFASNDTGTNNTAAGARALFSNINGSNNAAFGRQTLVNNTGGNFNAAVGASALETNTTGNFNTAVGFLALSRNTIASNNTGIGQSALRSNTTGTTNTAIGNAALAANNGSNNMGAGASALERNTSGSFNTAAGHRALDFNTTGNGNTSVGRDAMRTNTIGSNNTALGFGADVAAAGLMNATAIGANAVVDASNKIRLGDSSVTVIEGQVAFTSVSDKNQKENFRPVDGEAVLRKILDLPLTSWNYIGQDPALFRHYGPVAQDFFAAFGQDGVGTIGTPTTINSGDMAGILMIAVRELTKQNATLRERLQRLEDTLRRHSLELVTAETTR